MVLVSIPIKEQLLYKSSNAADNTSLVSIPIKEQLLLIILLGLLFLRQVSIPIKEQLLYNVGSVKGYVVGFQFL